MKNHLSIVLIASLLSAAASAQVRVTGSADRKIAVNLAGLQVAPDSASRLFFQTLENDLRRSGWLAPLRAGGEVILSGSVAGRGSKVNASIRATRKADGARLLEKGYALPEKQARLLAHRAADDLLKAITGRTGFASTKIALVGSRSGVKELWLCDADGGGLRQLTNDKSIAIAPNWGPYGNNIFYTSFSAGFPDIYHIDLTRGKRTRVASYGGLNTGAAISPDGKSMALILSKDGNPELYIQSLSGGMPKRLTTTLRATEASPCWSPDGQHLVYVSDQSGTPQLYVIGRGGGRSKRLSRRGSENVAPDWGPNGLIACASRENRRYHIAIIHPVTGETRYLPTDGADYEDPSWAPNGRHLAAKRTINYQSGVYLLDTANDPPVALTPNSGNWSAPAWSPR